MTCIRSFSCTASPSAWLCAALALLSLSAAGCQEGASHGVIESGQALLSLEEVPADVSCVRVTAAGEFRSSVTDIDVVPGQSVSQALTGLPIGEVVFSANAYAGACSGVTKSTVPTWMSDEKTVTLAQGKSSSVTLTLYRNGRAKVTVEFADREDGGTGTDAKASTPNAGAGADAKASAPDAGTRG